MLVHALTFCRWKVGGGEREMGTWNGSLFMSNIERGLTLVFHPFINDVSNTDGNCFEQGVIKTGH